MKVIYLDNASTTPVYREVVSEMEKCYLNNYGNPSSAHALGEESFSALQKAREKIAKSINARPWEIIFTSGGTESNNFALKGIISANKNKKKIIISSIEHSSIYETCLQLRKEGYEVIEVPVDKKGVIDFDFLMNAIDKETLLVSIMHVNNEIGVVQELKKIGEICRGKDILFHSDGVQSLGKEEVDVQKMKIDILSTSAHKIGGSKGIGFIYIRDGVKINPLIIGGGQEKGFRGGTENVPAIMGFAKALEIAEKIDKGKITKVRDYFILKLEELGGKINGSKEKRVCNNINVSLPLDAEMLVIYLSGKGIMCSTKSACLTKQKKENRILRALGLKENEIRGAVRFSLNEFITKKDIDFVLKEIEIFINHNS